MTHFLKCRIQPRIQYLFYLLKGWKPQKFRKSPKDRTIKILRLGSCDILLLCDYIEGKGPEQVVYKIRYEEDDGIHFQWTEPVGREDADVRLQEGRWDDVRDGSEDLRGSSD